MCCCSINTIHYFFKQNASSLAPQFLFYSTEVMSISSNILLTNHHPTNNMVDLASMLSKIFKMSYGNSLEEPKDIEVVIIASSNESSQLSGFVNYFTPS